MTLKINLQLQAEKPIKATRSTGRENVSVFSLRFGDVDLAEVTAQKERFLVVNSGECITASD